MKIWYEIWAGEKLPSFLKLDSMLALEWRKVYAIQGWG